MTILLSTLNARYAHASLGLRYLLANMGDLQDDTRLQEFVIGARTTDLVEKLLAHKPRIIGFGVYIWNVEETTKLVALLKRVAPEVVIILGGPEVSYEHGEQDIVRMADYLVTGWGDITFPRLCRELLRGPKPLMKVHAGEQPPMSDIALPYALYTDEDIAHRTLYVEASRGCPFKCEFCLSSLDKTAWAFDLQHFLAELEHPLKRRIGMRYSNEFYFVTPAQMVTVAEVPADCGLIEAGIASTEEWKRLISRQAGFFSFDPDTRHYCMITVPAPWRDTPGPTWQLVAAMLRNQRRELEERPPAPPAQQRLPLA